MHRSLIQPYLLAFYAGYVAALGPWSRHVTEPDHRSSMIQWISLPDDISLLDDSCIFITPYVSDFSQGSFGPQIFAADGVRQSDFFSLCTQQDLTFSQTLIWNGNYTAKVRAMDAHVCDYKGVMGQHICYNDAQPVEQAGHSAGAIRFFDNTYTQVGPDYGAEGRLRGPDIHELNTPHGLKGERFIQDVYERKKVDLRPYLGPEEGYILDGCFQEVEVRTKRVMFEWCALDHMPLYDTYVYPWGRDSPNFTIPITGNGDMDAPWDWFHINAISRNAEGDYAVSARHMNAIYKIAGNDNRQGVDPGTILWHLGGKRNDFTMDFNFSRQHTVRFHSIGPSTSTLSFFDNAYDGWARTAKWSSGKMVHIDNKTMTASLIATYDDPDQDVSFSQGSTQMLDNGNVFVGWGNRASFSEFSYDGQLLSHGNFSGGVESFRVWKFPWKGYPKQPPKIFSYAEDCNANLYAYASWNGATEVRAWSFYASWGTHNGPWHFMGTVPKSGFETMANFTALNENAKDYRRRSAYSRYAPYMYVTALDAWGRVMSQSNVAHTFVPKNETIAWKFNCTTHLCEAEFFRHEEIWSCGSSCARDYTAATWIVAGLVCIFELVAWLGGWYGWRYLSGRHDVRTGGNPYPLMNEYHHPESSESELKNLDEDDWDADWEKSSQTSGPINTAHDRSNPPNYNRIQVNKRTDRESEQGNYTDSYMSNVPNNSSNGQQIAYPERQSSLRTHIRTGSGINKLSDASLASGFGNLLSLFGLGSVSASEIDNGGGVRTLHSNIKTRPIRVDDDDEVTDLTRSRSVSGSYRRVHSGQQNSQPQNASNERPSAPGTPDPSDANLVAGRGKASGFGLNNL